MLEEDRSREDVIDGDAKPQRKPVREAHYFVRIVTWLVEGHRHWYHIILGVFALLPSVFYIQKFEANSALIISGLNFLIVAYVGDFLPYFVKELDNEVNDEVSLLHVFLVAWLLPFVLTLTPSMELIQNHNYIDLIAGAANVLEEHPDNVIDYYNSLIVPNFLHKALFSSLVVLVPLEFFALLVLRDRGNVIRQNEGGSQKDLEEKSKTLEYRRHALIAAGCLDVATLSFLSLVATDVEIAKFIGKGGFDFFGKIPIEAIQMLNVHLIFLWIFSLVSSFQAIYVAQYREMRQDIGSVSGGENRRG